MRVTHVLISVCEQGPTRSLCRLVWMLYARMHPTSGPLCVATVDVNVSQASEAYSASFVTLAHKSSRSQSLTQKHVNADGEFLVSL